jgi:predicted O-linked N-acetylglucosamine transferase (SPINDLY family)
MAGRADATRRFWLLAQQLRAALPPLLLPLRTGSAAPRIGYLLADGADIDPSAVTAHDERAVADAESFLYVRGKVARTAHGSVRRVAALDGLNELQAARVIAEDDLDLLVDVDGSSLGPMPVTLALMPARRIVEPLFAPPAASASAPANIADGAPADRNGTLAVVRSILEAISTTIVASNLQPPSVLNTRLNRGIQMHQAGERAAARAVYEDVLVHHPGHPIAAYLLGQLLHQEGDDEAAIASLARAVQSAPEFRDAHYTLGQRLVDRERWHEATSAYRRALDLTPGFAAGWSGLGLATLKAGQPARTAIGYLERAVALEPDVAQWSFNAGTALAASGDRVRARAAYDRALALDAEHVEARFNRAALAQQAGAWSDAIDDYRAVLARQPQWGHAYAQLGAALLQSGRIEEWLRAFRQYRANAPQSLAMATYGLEASMAMGEPAAYDAWLAGILSGAYASADATDLVHNWEELLFVLLHVDLKRAALRECYERYNVAATGVYGEPPGETAGRRPGPLRIGYLSGDFRDHVMGRMIHELVSHHDRERCEPILYSLTTSADSWTERFQRLGVRFVDLASMPYRAAAAKIAGDDVDILVDCCGHTRGAQQGILALKPARAVVTHIATPGPVGLAAIDAKLTDPLAESSDAQSYVLERLWPIDGGVFPWHRYPPPVPAERRAVGIADDAFVCAAFVSLLKLSPRCLALWRRVLERVPRAVLAFSPPGEDWKPSYLRWLGAHGIAPERIVFVPNSADEAMALGRYALVDVALDPMPCGNVNGTMEALALGVPVVTLAGRRHGELLGNALLTRFGIKETIARSEDEYVARIARLAEDAAWSAALRSRIRDAAERSHVWDSRSLVRHLEDAFDAILAEREERTRAA